MNGSQLHQLMNERKPKDLQHWSYQAMLASFPIAECPEVWGGTLQYIGWLNYDRPVLLVNPPQGG